MNQPVRPAPPPELSVYRDHCIALLRRYFCMAVEVGRLPALLGREIFRTNAQDYHVHSFENIVLFVIDVERCLDRLHPFDKELIARIVIQEYTTEEAARLLHCGLRTIERRLPEALDYLTEVFLRNRMLDVTKRVPSQRLGSAKAAAHCRKRLPQRAPAKPANDAALVKPPKTTIYAQADTGEGNIFFSDVAGLPSPICYAEYLS
jgi:hypothetical protein